MHISLKTAAAVLLQLQLILLLGCASADTTAPPEPQDDEPEAIARTEFTSRLENFFEYEPLHAGKPSQVRIHLTDLSDGSPVEQAQVTLTVRPSGKPQAVAEITAKVGKVTGIYVADLNLPQPGGYDIEFRIKNATLDERMPLTDFKVE